MKKTIFIFLMALSVISCKSNQEETQEINMAQQYKITVNIIDSLVDKGLPFKFIVNETYQYFQSTQNKGEYTFNSLEYVNSVRVKIRDENNWNQYHGVSDEYYYFTFDDLGVVEVIPIDIPFTRRGITIFSPHGERICGTK